MLDRDIIERIDSMARKAVENGRRLGWDEAEIRSQAPNAVIKAVEAFIGDEVREEASGEGRRAIAVAMAASH